MHDMLGRFSFNLRKVKKVEDKETSSVFEVTWTLDVKGAVGNNTYFKQGHQHQVLTRPKQYPLSFP